MATLGHCGKCGARWVNPDVHVPGFRPRGMCRCSEHPVITRMNGGKDSTEAVLAALTRIEALLQDVLARIKG